MVMNASTMPTFRRTINVFDFADSFTPRTRRHVIALTIPMAGRLKTMGMPATRGASRTAVARNSMWGLAVPAATAAAALVAER